MKNLIPLGAVNLLLVSVYLVPVWTKDALRVLNSPFGGLHDRSHAAAVGLIREFLGLGIDGMLVVSQVLAGLKLLVVAAMVAFYIDVIRAVALPTGLVDVKVAAVDEVWSGLKLVRRLKNR